jgi:arabinan endo-1,5-alpha-L-arabinosidase
VRHLVLCCATALLASCALMPEPTAQYTNPVHGRDFPDPAVLRAPDGWFYVYGTQTDIAGKMLNLQVARSRDLVQWEHLGDALPAKPTWASAKQVLWAPDVLYDSGQRKYFMYYSAEPDTARGKCLAVAVSVAPQGPFTDSGRPLLCGRGIEHIDPMAFDDPRTGKRLLYWGSGGSPIRVQELAADRLGFLPGSAPKDLLFADDRPYRSLIEGAWVIHRNGTYFLFYSGDRCCDRHPRYAVMVARSSDPLGPFEDFGAPILENSGFWIAPGHNSVATDDAGTDWMLYHAIDAAASYYEGSRARVMMLDRIDYRDGWPRVEGGQPSTQRRPRPALRHTAPQ